MKASRRIDLPPLKSVRDVLKLFRLIRGGGLHVEEAFPSQRDHGKLRETEVMLRMAKKAYHPESLTQPENVTDMVASVLGLPRTAKGTDLTVRPMAKPL